MTLDQDACYRAFRSRDRRFEGRFVVAVKTTGIYCRPGCPARLPRRENVRFLPSTAAAEEAGFRACMRCRPDASPDSAAWLGTSAVVARALRLIDEGALDDAGVEELAARLGMGERHLRRLFVELLGAPPRAIARTRKAHFARKLLEETDLAVSVVALSAGFGSVRRFNTAMRETFGRSPRELRKARRGGRTSPRGGLVLRLPYKPPFDWTSLLEFMGPRAIPGVEIVEGNSYRRTVRIDGSAGTIEVSPLRGSHALTLRVDIPLGPGLDRLVRRVRRLFDLDADPDRIARDLRRDLLLARLLRGRPGIRVPGAWDGFETAVRAILGQQVSVRGATTLSGRLVILLGEPLDGPVGGKSISGENAGGRAFRDGATSSGGLTHLFPGPDVVAGADLSRIGIPRGRAAAIRGLAEALLAGTVSLDALHDMEEAVARLSALPGIGPWTAQYIAMRVLGEPDAMPFGDLGLQRTLGMTEAALRKRSEAWRPWRAYAAMHIWSSGAGSAGSFKHAAASGGKRRSGPGVGRGGAREIRPVSSPLTRKHAGAGRRPVRTVRRRG
jgi:AraC family transcriptional regulator of adaptative response / DNA-3-methyladenine glycosylase II